ncbi:MbtH family NRPS accessory protein [Rugamonas sp. FT107W]|uniref:MbtH family NRPS accessory protein n=1 Tax=Duganella vulcania TaxID=2692166 RepID=A0A845HG05_9BURK|nr:MbtH family protein [Duganella vulcania]MYN17598.1 MbtH family NRPS accessory protein [Duganella vulcania]
MGRERFYEVVVNAEGQYSVWPAQWAVPGGWRAAGFRDTREQCLRHIDSVWLDQREYNLRVALSGKEPRHG